MLTQGIAFGGGQGSHEFADKNRTCSVSLVRDNLTLTLQRYDTWEHLKSYLTSPLNALRELYSPPFYVRVGLRYRNVVRPSKLGLTGVAWKELLNPWTAGPFCSDDVEKDVERTAHQHLIRLAEGRGRVLLQHGLIQDQPQGELSYAIDSDFFSDDQTEDANVIELLDYLHRQARHLFRWCIGKRLHEALEPRLIPSA